MRARREAVDAELRRLSDLGIGGLDIGVESGLDAALTYMNKGHTAEEAKEQLLRLTKAGISYGFNAILGCGGADLWRENADATVRTKQVAAPIPTDAEEFLETPMNGHSPRN